MLRDDKVPLVEREAFDSRDVTFRRSAAIRLALLTGGLFLCALVFLFLFLVTPLFFSLNNPVRHGNASGAMEGLMDLGGRLHGHPANEPPGNDEHNMLLHGHDEHQHEHEHEHEHDEGSHEHEEPTKSRDSNTLQQITKLCSCISKLHGKGSESSTEYQACLKSCFATTLSKGPVPVTNKKMDSHPMGHSKSNATGRV